MKYINILLFFVTIQHAGFSQTPEIKWLQAYEATMGCAIDEVVMTDSFVFVAIQFQGDIVISGQEFSSFGLFDLLLICYDRSGELNWVHQAGSDNIDNTSTLDWSPDGSIIWSGLFWDKLFLGGSEFNVTVRSRAIFLCSIDAISGSLKWCKVVQGAGLKEANTTATDTAGKVLLGGHFNTSLFVDSIQIAEVPAVSGYVLMFDKSGQLLIDFVSRGAGEGRILAACMHGDLIYISGTYQDEVILADDTLSGPILDTDIFLAALDQNAHLIWVQTAKGLLDDTVIDLQMTLQNDLLLSGNFSGRLVFGNGLEMQSQGFASDIFICRYGLDAIAQSVIQITNPGNDVLESVSRNSLGWVLSGTFDQEFTWDGESVTTPAGSRSGFILHLTEDLENTIFTEIAGSSGFLATCISGAEGVEYVSGISLDQATTFLDETFQASGMYKAVLMVYKQRGNATTDPDSQNFRYQVFPNPARDHIRTDMEGLSGLILFDLQGKILRESNQPELDLAGLGNGPYILTIIRKDQLRRSVIIMVQN